MNKFIIPSVVILLMAGAAVYLVNSAQVGKTSEENTAVENQAEELPAHQAAETQGTVHVGETVNINGVRLTLGAIISDNRCPKDVMCIVAGAVKTSITLQSDTDKETRELSSDQAPVGFDSYHISITNVQPTTISTKTIRTDEYMVTFKVSAN